MTSTRSPTDQERFWTGPFGDQYTERNSDPDWVARNRALFARALARTTGIASVLELGGNRGLALAALRQLLPAAALSAVEINASAAGHLAAIDRVTIHRQSILDFLPPSRYDLVVTKTVLIHIAPADLPQVYDLLLSATARYLLVAEYYNPTPIEVTYRGHTGVLWKRDFAGELMDRHPSLHLVDYGFTYHRDPVAPQDDLTWFLLEKH